MKQFIVYLKISENNIIGVTADLMNPVEYPAQTFINGYCYRRGNNFIAEIESECAVNAVGEARALFHTYSNGCSDKEG